jgi:hypothetical protein
MDADYRRNIDRDGAPSLFVWATVMSRPTEDRAIVDAGLKALAFDSGLPPVGDEPAATYERASDEHGRLGISGATNRLGLGDKIRLVPGHATRPSTSTTGTSPSAATASSSSGPSAPAARFIDAIATSHSLCFLGSLSPWYSFPRPSAPAGVRNRRAIMGIVGWSVESDLGCEVEFMLKCDVE